MTWWRNKKQDSDKELARMLKVQESQKALLSAATGTADIAQDVTSKLKARLDDSLRQLEMTANLLSDALVICKSDGIVNSFNPAAERIFGWDAADILGKNITLLFRSASGEHLSSDEIWECLSNGPECMVTDDHHFKVECVRGKRKNGKMFYLDGDLTYLERQDGVTIVMLLIKDITTRIELQRQLQVSETRYRSIFESNFDGIMVVQNFHVVAANPAMNRMLEYSSEEMIAKAASQFFHPDYQRAINDINTAYLNGNTSSHNFLVKGISSTGQEVEMMFTSAFMYWEGKPSSLIALKDITEIRKVINATQ